MTPYKPQEGDGERVAILSGRLVAAFLAAFERSKAVVTGGSWRLFLALERTGEYAAEVQPDLPRIAAKFEDAICLFDAYTSATDGQLRDAAIRGTIDLRPRRQPVPQGADHEE